MLLDTHVLIWYLTGDPQLPQKLKEQITAEPLVYVSAAVIWEIAISWTSTPPMPLQRRSWKEPTRTHLIECWLPRQYKKPCRW